MKTLRSTLLLSILFIQLQSFAQTDISKMNFDKTVMIVEGDLNKDGLADKVIITQDTLNEKAPYRLQIFFKEPTGKLKLIVSSDRIIEPQYPEGRNGFATGDGFDSVIISKGVLSINFELLRGHYEHIFRYQNGNFELIGFSMVYSDGQGVMTETDFNLSTGNRVTIKERYDTNKIISNIRKKILIRPLPKLQDIVPMETDLY